MSLTDDFTEQTDTPLTDRKQVRERKDTAMSAEKRRRATLAGILNVKEGRELFWWLLEQYRPTHSPLASGAYGVDVNRTMFNVGLTDAGRLLLAEITATAPDKYILMLQEEQERQELRKQGNA